MSTSAIALLKERYEDYKDGSYTLDDDYEVSMEALKEAMGDEVTTDDFMEVVRLTISLFDFTH